jgi:predicted alpha/beta hydrolase
MKELVKVLAWDGYSLTTTRFSPNVSNGRSVLIISEVGKSQSLYADFALFLSNQGYTVYTFDFRGIGLSNLKNFNLQKVTLNDWAALDLDAMLSFVTSSRPSDRLIVSAHGISNLLLGMSRLSKKADAFLMIASTVPNAGRITNVLTRWRMKILSNFVLPLSAHVFGKYPGWLSGGETLPKKLALQLSQWYSSENALSTEINKTENTFILLEQRALIINFQDDYYSSSEEFKLYYPNIRFDDWTFTPDQVLQKKMGHDGFFNRKLQNVVWSEVGQWLNQNLNIKKGKAA